MQSSKSYIKDTSDFLRKLNELGKLLENAILLTTDVVDFHPTSSHSDGLEVLSAKLEEQEDKSIATENLLQMTKFVLRSIFFNLIPK